jgi:hypothetical protein
LIGLRRVVSDCADRDGSAATLSAASSVIDEIVRDGMFLPCCRSRRTRGVKKALAEIWNDEDKSHARGLDDTINQRASTPALGESGAAAAMF